jgi:hypothetical protein
MVSRDGSKSESRSLLRYDFPFRSGTPWAIAITGINAKMIVAIFFIFSLLKL